MAILDKYAELVLAGKEPVTSKSIPALVGYDVALERQRLEFQLRQWEADKAEKEEQGKFELAEKEEQIKFKLAKKEEQRKFELARIEAARVGRDEQRKFE